MNFPVILWLFAGIALALATPLLADYLWILAPIPILIWAVLGGVLGVLTKRRLRHPEQRRSAQLALLAMALVTMTFCPTAELGSSLVRKARFADQRGRYEQMVARLRDSVPEAGRYETDGLRYVVDGPPLRLAFPWPGGMIDNWCGAVYDPTSVVLQANNFDGNWAKWEEEVPVDVIKLFGGDLVHCQELDSPYYCCFT